MDKLVTLFAPQGSGDNESLLLLSSSVLCCSLRFGETPVANTSYNEMAEVDDSSITEKSSSGCDNEDADCCGELLLLLLLGEEDEEVTVDGVADDNKGDLCGILREEVDGGRP